MTVDNRPKKSKITINNIDVTPYVTGVISEHEYDKYIGTATITVNKNIISVLGTDILDNAPGYKVTWQRGILTSTEKYIFRGEIITVESEAKGFTFECNDRYYETVRNSITSSFDINIDTEQGVGSEIYKTMILDHTNLLPDDTTVVSTASLLKIDKFVCNNTDVFERCDKLAKFYNYQHYYDADLDKPVFEPKGYHVTGDSLTVGVDIVKVPKWKNDKTKLINKLTVKGAEQKVEITQFKDGDNTDAQTVVLNYIPVSVKVYVGTGSFDPTGTGTKPSDNASNLLVGGKKGSTSGVYDYDYDDDKRIRTVYFHDNSKDAQPSYIPPAGTNNIEVQYTYSLPIQSKGSDETSIDTYEVHEKEIQMSDFKTFDDADNYRNAYLSLYSTPFTSTTLKVINNNNLLVGRVYTIVDNVNNVNKDFIITKIKRNYPYTYDEVTVGDKILRELEFNLSTMDRVKRLEEITSGSNDLLIETVLLNNDLLLESRSFETQLIDRSGDGVNTFILGHPTFGILGTQKLGTNNNTTSTIKLVQGKNTYKELLYDTDFYDSTNSTNVTWDTINKKITLNSSSTSSVLLTKPLTVGTKYSYCTVLLGDFVDNTNITYFISGDNGVNWQSVTLDIRTILNNSDNTSVLFKIVSDGTGGTYTLTNTMVNGELSKSAIKIKLEE